MSPWSSRLNTRSGPSGCPAKASLGESLGEVRIASNANHSTSHAMRVCMHAMNACMNACTAVCIQCNALQHHLTTSLVVEATCITSACTMLPTSDQAIHNLEQSFLQLCSQGNITGRVHFYVVHVLNNRTVRLAQRPGGPQRCCNAGIPYTVRRYWTCCSIALYTLLVLYIWQVVERVKLQYS